MKPGTQGRACVASKPPLADLRLRKPWPWSQRFLKFNLVSHKHPKQSMLHVGACEPCEALCSDLTQFRLEASSQCSPNTVSAKLGNAPGKAEIEQLAHASRAL